MGNRLLGETTPGSSHALSALIRPKNNLTYMFEWARPSGEGSFLDVGGGGVDGIAFGDWIGPPTQAGRNQTIDGAINVDEAPYFTIRDSYFAWLKGRAVRMGRCVIGRVENTWIVRCGDTGKSAVDLDGSSLNTSIDKLIIGVAKAPDPSTLIRVTVPSHGYSTNDIVYIAFVQGTIEANGAWKITVINANEFDLTESFPPPGSPSQFDNTYISGGKASKDGIFAALWGNSMGLETCSHGAAWIKGTTMGHAWLKHCYFEDGAANDQSFVDQSAGGTLTIDGCSLNGTSVTQVIVGGVGSSIRNSNLTADLTGDTPHILVNSSAAQSKFENLAIRGNALQSGRSLDVQANFCQLSNIYMNTTGQLKVSSAVDCELSNIYLYNPAAGNGTYAIELGTNSLNGAKVRGFGSNLCHGIRLTAGKVTNSMVTGLNNRNGITVDNAINALVANNWCHSLGTSGLPFVFYNGNMASGNYGYAAAATAVAGAATLHAESGVITSEPLTTLAGAVYVLLVTNQLCLANWSRITAAVQRGTDTQALSYQVQEVFPNNGSFYIWVKNTGAAAIGTGNPPPNDAATIRIHFKVEN
jgi:hypothetical protein